MKFKLNFFFIQSYIKLYTFNYLSLKQIIECLLETFKQLTTLLD